MDKAKFNEARWHILAGIEVLPDLLKDYERIQDENEELRQYKARVEGILATLPAQQQKNFWAVGRLILKYRNKLIENHLTFEEHLLYEIDRFKRICRDDISAFDKNNFTEYWCEIIDKVKAATQADLEILEMLENKVKAENQIKGE